MISRRSFVRLAALAAAWPQAAWSQAAKKAAKPAPGTILVNDVHSQLNSTRVFRIASPTSVDAVRGRFTYIDHGTWSTISPNLNVHVDHREEDRNAPTLSADPELPGFVLDLEPVWRP